MARERAENRQILAAAAIVLLQILACIFFILDAISDQSEAGAGAASLLELGVAVALLTGILVSAAYIMRLRREVRLRATAVAIAKGALSDILVDRFAQWGLSNAEADVALFALKGCSIAEIAELRTAAPGTVRAQLSQIYAKAGVSSQPMLMSLFLDELMTMDAPATR